MKKLLCTKNKELCTTNQDRHPFNKELKKLRLRDGLSQLALARILGLHTPQFISNIERNIAPPPFYLVEALSDIFEQSESKLLSLWQRQHEFHLIYRRRRTLGWLERLDLKSKQRSKSKKQ